MVVDPDTLPGQDEDDLPLDSSAPDTVSGASVSPKSAVVSDPGVDPGPLASGDTGYPVPLPQSLQNALQNMRNPDAGPLAAGGSSSGPIPLPQSLQNALSKISTDNNPQPLPAHLQQAIRNIGHDDGRPIPLPDHLKTALKDIAAEGSEKIPDHLQRALDKIGYEIRPKTKHINPPNGPTNTPGSDLGGPKPSQVAASGNNPQANQQINQANDDLNAAAKVAQPYAGTAPGSIHSTDEQSTGDTLNNLETQKNWAAKQGQIDSSAQSQLAAKQLEAANEKIQQAKDFSALQSSNLDKYNTAHAQTQAAYDEYRKKAGSLKDPNSQFWEDKGQGSRITAALAAFSSGMGAGLTGHGGNPFMDFLSHQIDNNFQAHKQNIEDLYNSSVAAGKIEDTVENHNRFMNEAKLKSYDISSAHINNELEAIKNSSASQTAKVTAANAQAGLEQQGIQARQALAAKEAAKAAAALAAQRAAAALAEAKRKEGREFYGKQLDVHSKDMGDDEARDAALRDTVGAGFDRNVVAPIAGANNIPYDAKKDQWAIPPKAPDTSVQEPTYDASGKLVVPTKTSQGKIIPPEEQEKQRKDILERTSNVDGKPAIFRTKEAAETASSVPAAEKLLATMNKAWKEGDKGSYDQARLQFVEMGPKLLGYKRGPSGAQAGEGYIGRDADRDQDKATIADQLPEFEVLHRFGIPSWPVSQKEQAFENSNPLGIKNNTAGIAQSKLAAVGKTLEDIKSDIRSNLVTPTKAPEKQLSPAELAKKLGGKVIK